MSTVLTPRIPGDKSISHRALIVGAISEGLSTVEGLLFAEDPKSTLGCLRAMGCEAEWKGSLLHIQGHGLRGFHQPTQMLDAGNSGTTIRLLSGVLAGQRFPTVISGDESLRQRPMMRIVRPLVEMGASISASDGRPPLTIQPSPDLRSITYELPIPSAQVKSAVLLAGLYAEGTTRIIEIIRTRDHTERILGLSTKLIDGTHVTAIQGGTIRHGQRFVIPGDISSAVFFVAAALLTPGAEVILRNIGINPTRMRGIDILRSVGAAIDIQPEAEHAGEPIGTIVAQYSSLAGEIRLGRSDVIGMIDEIPIVAALAAAVGISFEVRGAAELRVKESDRISAMVANLRALGVDVEEYDDGFAFGAGKRLQGGLVRSRGDHRIAMAFGVMDLTIKRLEIDDPNCVDISFPGFWKELEQFSRLHDP